MLMKSCLLGNGSLFSLQRILPHVSKNIQSSDFLWLFCVYLSEIGWKTAKLSVNENWKIWHCIFWWEIPVRSHDVGGAVINQLQAEGQEWAIFLPEDLWLYYSPGWCCHEGSTVQETMHKWYKVFPSQLFCLALGHDQPWSKLWMEHGHADNGHRPPVNE